MKCKDCGTPLRWAWEAAVGLCAACGPGSTKAQTTGRTRIAAGVMQGAVGQPTNLLEMVNSGQSLPPGSIPKGVTLREDILPGIDGDVVTEPTMINAGPGMQVLRMPTSQAPTPAPVPVPVQVGPSPSDAKIAKLESDMSDMRNMFGQLMGMLAPKPTVVEAPTNGQAKEHS